MNLRLLQPHAHVVAVHRDVEKTQGQLDVGLLADAGLESASQVYTPCLHADQRECVGRGLRVPGVDGFENLLGHAVQRAPEVAGRHKLCLNAVVGRHERLGVGVLRWVL